MGYRERNAQALVDERRPALPGIEYLRHVIPWPGHRGDRYLANRVHAEREGGSDAEVPSASAAQRPEEIGVLLLAGVQHIAVSIDQIDGEEVVAGESVLA